MYLVVNEWVGSNSWELGLIQPGTWSWGGAHIGHLSALSLSTACNVWVLGEQDVGRKNGNNCRSNNKRLHLRTAQGKSTQESRETFIPLLCGSATLFGKGACAGNRSQSHPLAWPSPSTAALPLILTTWAKVPKSHLGTRCSLKNKWSRWEGWTVGHFSLSMIPVKSEACPWGSEVCWEMKVPALVILRCQVQEPLRINAAGAVVALPRNFAMFQLLWICLILRCLRADFAASECLDTASTCEICSILFSPLSYKMSAGKGTARNLIKGGHVGMP